MFTFFRHIRKGLLGTGQARKYLAYAVGEILLVMIGILLALQVNNWNQKRLELIEEENLYCTIQQEMGLFKFYQEEGLERYENIIASAEQLLLYINDPALKISKQQIDEYLSDLGRRWLTGAGSVTNIYDLLISSGKLELLNSIEVRENLRNFNSHLEYMLTYEEMQADFVDNRLNPYLDQYVDRISISAMRLDLSEPLRSSRFNTSYDVLLNDKEFANLLITLIRRSRTLVQTYGRLGNYITSLDLISEQRCPKETSLPISSSQ